MAFQGNGFQNDAFQTGAPTPDSTPPTVLISDGNETVQILHEQNQHVDHLGTTYQPPPIDSIADPAACNYPAINGWVTTALNSTVDPHTIQLPPSAVGDLLLIVSGINADASAASATGWTFLETNRIVILYKVADGSEGTSVSVDYGFAREVSAHAFVIAKGTFDPAYAPEIGVRVTATSTTPDPPSLTASWGAKEALWFAAICGGNAAFDVTAYPSGFTYSLGETDDGVHVTTAFAAKQSASATEDPGTFTISASIQWQADTFAIKGFCPSEPLYSNGLDYQDFTDHVSHTLGTDTFTLQHGGDCLTPTITNAVTGVGATGLSFAVNLPSGITLGELLVLYIGATNGSDITVTGWNKLYGSNSLAHNGAFFWKVATGSEGATATVDRGSNSAVTYPYWSARVVGADSAEPVFATFNPVTTDIPDPPSITPTPAGEPAVYLVPLTFNDAQSVSSFPSGYDSNQATQDDAGGTGNLEIAIAAKYGVFAFENPGTYTLSASSDTVVNTVGIRGSCNQEPVFQTASINLDSQDFTDFADYGTTPSPAVEGAAAQPEEPLYSNGLDDQDWTDLADYSSSVDPAIADNNPEVAPQALDGQDFSDLADYGTQTDETIADNNPEVCVAAIALDTQDFTDLADYGFSWNAPADLDEQDPDLGQIDCDSQDFTDYADYSSQTDQPIDDNNPEVAPQALDDQDFTDLADYGFSVDPLIDDFVLLEDFTHGDGLGLDDQDWTDHADYGFLVAPLSDDSVDFLLGTGDGLDTQDFTDLEDYGSVTPQAIPDNNPEVAPSDLDTQDFTDLSDYSYIQAGGFEQDHHLGTGDGLDTQDFTDLEDYGSVTPQAILDNNGEVAPSSLDTQDFTDFEDYGYFNPQAIPDNNPEVAPSDLDTQDFTDTEDYGSIVPQAIEDNTPDLAPSSLDDQDFTDFEDYGSSSGPLADDVIVPQDFILGDGKGLDDQDFTDTADYSFTYVQPPENVTEVPVTGVDLIVVSIGCYEVSAWAIPSDPTMIWAAIADPANNWSTPADPSTTWTPVSEPNTVWTEVANVSNTWIKDC